MKRFSVVLIIGLIVSLSIGTYAAANGIGQPFFNQEIKVNVNGTLLDSQLVTVIVEGETGTKNYVPVRELAEALGATVTWNEETKVISVNSQADPIHQQVEDIINNLLVGAEKVFEETKEDILANNGQNIGTYYDQREASGDGIKFMASEGENPFMPLAMRIDEAEGINPGGNQAFYMKFKPTKKDFGFMLSSKMNIGITVGVENEPVLFLLDENFRQPLDTKLRVEPNNWYHIFMAIGSDGLFKGAFWKDGAESEAAYFDIGLSAYDDGRYIEQSWQVNIGYQGEASLTVDNYAYYTFKKDMDFNDPMNMAAGVLNDPQVINGEDVISMIDNMGGMFSYAAVKKPSDDGSYFIFGSDSEGVLIKRNENLYYNNRHNCQGIMIKFMPEKVERLTFTMIDKDEVLLQFEDNHPHYVNIQRKAPYSDFRESSLTLENNKWYWALMAVDGEGNYRSLVWENSNAENNAFCEDRVGEGNTWRFSMSFGENQRLNVMEYRIVDFNGFGRINLPGAAGKCKIRAQGRH